MRKIFITATNTDIGKTYTTCKLIESYANMGYKVGVIKPIETGVETTPLDGEKLLLQVQKYNPEFNSLHVNDIVPIQFTLPAAPFIASGGESIDLSIIQKAIQKLEHYCDILLIEGAGGLMVPVDTNTMMYEFIEQLECDATLLISHCVLGCISDTLVNRAFLESKQIPHIWALNCKDSDSFQNISKPYFDYTCKEYYIVDRDIDKIALDLYNTDKGT